MTPSPTPTATATPIPAPNVILVAIRYATGDEYFTVSNTGTAPQTMTGWKLVSYDGATCTSLPATQAYYFPSGYVLAAGGSVRVHSGPNAVSNPPGDLLWTTKYIWNDDGDRGDLFAVSGTLVDWYAYGSCR